jgi:secretion/DNA translocation related TadE-like protein
MTERQTTGGRLATGGRGVTGGCQAAGDRGAASLFLLAIGRVFVAAGVAGAAVGAARVGRHEARTAADLGALAGAAHAIEGEAAACTQATQVVVANEARVTSCEVDGMEIIVRVDVTVTPLPGLVRHATAAARAGPVYRVPECCRGGPAAVASVRRSVTGPSGEEL